MDVAPKGCVWQERDCRVITGSQVCTRSCLVEWRLWEIVWIVVEAGG